MEMDVGSACGEKAEELTLPELRGSTGSSRGNSLPVSAIFLGSFTSAFREEGEECRDVLVPLGKVDCEKAEIRGSARPDMSMAV
jgi:hypothetical protein